MGRAQPRGHQGGDVAKASKNRGGKPSPKSSGAALRLGWNAVIAFMLGTIAFILLFGWDGVLPLLLVPLLVGAFTGLMSEDVREAALVGGGSGLLGSMLSVLFYQQDSFLAYLQKTNPAAMADVTGSLWSGFVLPLMKASPVNDSRVGPFVVVAIGTLLTLGVSAGVSWLVARLTDVHEKRWLGLLVILPLGLCLAATIFGGGSSFVQSVSAEPADGTYAFDGVINVRTYYLVRGGMDYYHAIVRAAAGDSRLAKAGEIKNGKFVGYWGSSPTFIRQPAVFYFWAVVGYFGASGIVWASLLLAIGLWTLWYWVLYPRLGQRALFVALALFPLCVVHMAWLNLFMPDWWAALMLGYSAALLVGRRFMAAAALALVAVLFREILVFWLAVLIAAACWQWLRKRLAVRYPLAFGGAFVAFVLAYAAHYFLELPYQAAMTGNEGTLGRLLTASAFPLSQKFFGPTSYLMFPYGDAVVPAFLLVLSGAAGFFLVIRDNELARTAIPAYLLIFLAFLFVVGASSSYWGQDLSLLAVTGTAVLLAGLDRLGWKRVREPA